MIDIAALGEEFYRVDHANNGVRGESFIRFLPVIGDESPRRRTIRLICDAGTQQERSVLGADLR